MSTANQLIIVILGTIFAALGTAVFAKRVMSGHNKNKITGVECGFSISMFVVGCSLLALPAVAPEAQGDAPEFTEQFVYDEQMISPNYFGYNIRQFPTLDIFDFLEVTRVAFGHDHHNHQIFQIAVTITNTSEHAIVLAPNKALFTLEGKSGPATLLYLCCSPQSGELLTPKQKRKLLLFFQSRGLYRGEDMFFGVQDLQPIQREIWQFSRHTLPPW